MGGGGGFAAAGNDVDPDLLDKLTADLDNLRKEFESYRDHSLKNLQELNQTMPTKADKSDLVDLENRFNDKLNELLR